jgi:hypothetical protein
MAQKIWERSQGSRRPLSIKLLVTLVGVLCLGIALLVITPIYAAPTAKTSSQIATSGGGCNATTFKSPKVASRVVSVQICINVKGQNVVSETFVKSVKGSLCPDSVSLLLQDKIAPQSSSTFSGCGHFRSSSLPLQPDDTYFGHVDFFFNNDDGTVEPSGLESPFLDTTS